MKWILRFLSVVFLVPAGICLVIIANYHAITYLAQDRIYVEVSKVPFRTYTLVLGAGSSDPAMWENHTFDHRMEAVLELYNHRKTDTIIASGISNRPLYNEPNDMKKRLMEGGIPFLKIYPDHGGQRTWESVLRTRSHYHADKIIIVSQKEQLERAVFSARAIGIDAIGFEAEGLSKKQHRFWTYREYLSRMKCTLDAFAYRMNL